MMTTTRAVQKATKAQVPTILVTIFILIAYILGGYSYRYVCTYHPLVEHSQDH